MVAELYTDESDENERPEGEIIPVSLPTKPAGTIVNSLPDFRKDISLGSLGVNPQLKAAQDLNAAIKVSVSKRYKIVNGKRHEITEEWIGPPVAGGYVNDGTSEFD